MEYVYKLMVFLVGLFKLVVKGDYLVVILWEDDDVLCVCLGEMVEDEDCLVLIEIEY